MGLHGLVMREQHEVNAFQACLLFKMMTVKIHAGSWQACKCQRLLPVPSCKDFMSAKLAFLRQEIIAWPLSVFPAPLRPELVQVTSGCNRRKGNLGVFPGWGTISLHFCRAKQEAPILPRSQDAVRALGTWLACAGLAGGPAAADRWAESLALLTSAG